MIVSAETLADRDLLVLSRRELDALYIAANGPGAVPIGPTDGTTVFLTGTWFDRVAAAVVRLLVWRGTWFNRNGTELVNIVSPLRLRAVRAEVYAGAGLLDGGPATIIDYSRTSLVARWVRGEIRQIAPGLWLGKVFLFRRHILDFILTTRSD